MFTSLGKREIAKYGAILVLAAIGLWFFGAAVSCAFYYLLIIPTLLFGFLLYFFRDPERQIPTDHNAILSPADGTITHLEKVPASAIIGEECWRVSIFLSVFNVHLNRAPFAGAVTAVTYQKGSFLDARDNASLDKNESNTIVFRSDHPRLPVFAIRQIAGLIARRIVCIVKPNDQICAGSRVGMMKFSSRTDLLVPVKSGVTWQIKIGDAVFAGTSVLGKLASE
ncbi:phosphatidylserine decarboxylase proenzyme [Planctomycetales bacterium]|nr:phosphatidylserine decarboxylase proenzyme [Planctomycetales bacterium]